MKKYFIILIAILININMLWSVCVEKKKIIDEIKHLKSSFLSKNVDSLAYFFEFPITDIDTKEIIANYYSRFETSNDTLGIPKSTFFKYFDKIFGSPFFELLNVLDIDSLRFINEIEKKILIINNSPCNKHDFYIFSINIVNNNIYLKIFYSIDSTFDDADDCTEWLMIYEFTYKKNKLIFNKMWLAG
jgi:hypothetical protein